MMDEQRLTEIELAIATDVDFRLGEDELPALVALAREARTLKAKLEAAEWENEAQAGYLKEHWHRIASLEQELADCKAQLKAVSGNG